MCAACSERPLWHVIVNTGDHAILERGHDRIILERPDNPDDAARFLQLRSDATVDNALLGPLILRRDAA
jgi:hypothetical protein